MNIGTTIKRLRKEKNISQTEFAKKCGLSQTALSQIEIGNSRPSKKNLDAICNVLGAPEQLIYLLSVELNDVPESKKEQYEQLYPIISELVLKLFQDVDSKK